MVEPRVTPYIWVTWLPKLLVGEASCEWAPWFKSRNESWTYDKVTSDFDAATWQMNHTALLNRIQEALEAEGKAVFTEGQNKFALKGTSATLGGKPDLITTTGATGTIYDAKTGKPSPAHLIQLMIYMYAIPKALKQYAGVEFQGKIVYQDHEVVIPSSAIDETFIDNLGRLIRRVSSLSPARKVPSATECKYCNLTVGTCPERVVSDQVESGMTSDF
jgi:hypothetical protein